MTTITARHVDHEWTLEVELKGHDLERHCQQAFSAWYEATTEPDGIEDFDDWEIGEVTTGLPGNWVLFQATPYRGEGVLITFQPPKA